MKTMMVQTWRVKRYRLTQTIVRKSGLNVVIWNRDGEKQYVVLKRDGSVAYVSREEARQALAAN